MKFEMKHRILFWRKKDAKVIHTCGYSRNYQNNMLGHLLMCPRCKIKSVVIGEKKSVDCGGFTEFKNHVEYFEYRTKGTEVIFAESKICAKKINGNWVHLENLYNNMGYLSMKFSEEEVWRKPIPSFEKRIFSGRSNIQTAYLHDFDALNKSVKLMQKQNKYLSTKACFEIAKDYTLEVLKNKDMQIIERLYKTYPDKLHLYIIDNLNFFDFNKAERKFIIDNKLDFEKMKCIKEKHKLDLKFIERWCSNDKYEESFKKRYVELDLEIGNYFVKMPKEPHELTIEGKKLKHCVSGYKNKHAENRCTILFLRDKKEPDKPLVTIEYREKEIVQYRTTENDEPSRKILKLKPLIEKELKKVFG